MSTLAQYQNIERFTCTGTTGIEVTYVLSPRGANPYAADRWVCAQCNRRVDTDPGRPLTERDLGHCVNGHCTCLHCGKVMARLACGCAREHSWHHCPGKTEADKLCPQHATPGGHRVRP